MPRVAKRPGTGKGAKGIPRGKRAAMALSYPKLKKAALTAVLSTRTLAEAAKQIGVGAATLSEWTEREDFARDLAVAQDRVFGRAMDKLLATTKLATDQLEKVLSPKSKATDSNKIRAAGLVLEFALKVCEVRTLAERMDQLERILNAGDSKQPKEVRDEPGSGPETNGVPDREGGIEIGSLVAIAGEVLARPGAADGGGRDDTGPLADDRPPLFGI